MPSEEAGAAAVPGDANTMLTIAWDVDDVLNDLTRRWLAWFRKRAKSELPDYDDLIANPPHELLDITRDEYLGYLDEFRLTDAARGQHPVPEVFAWFERNGDRYRHVALTATPLVTAPVSAEWVTRTFGRWIRTFHFVPSAREDDGLATYETKGEFLSWFGLADVLVDDSPANLEGAREAGVDALAFPRPWNDAPGTAADALMRLDDLLRTKEQSRG